MVTAITCVRCHRALDMMGFYRDAIAFEAELLADYIEPEDGDVICDDCASLIVEEDE